jgi:hypothetical protein
VIGSYENGEKENNRRTKTSALLHFCLFSELVSFCLNFSKCKCLVYGTSAFPASALIFSDIDILRIYSILYRSSIFYTLHLCFCNYGIRSYPILCLWVRLLPPYNPLIILPSPIHIVIVSACIQLTLVLHI